jgi:hypothetical protein
LLVKIFAALMVFLTAASGLASCAAARTDFPAESRSGDQAGARSGKSSAPAPPEQYLDTAYKPSRGRVHDVRAGDNLQSALNAAAAGDVIALAPGATFAGNFKLPKKPGADWITIRPADETALPPAGTRINPEAHSKVMPKLMTSNADPVLRTEAGAHHYRLVGLEFATAPGVALNYNLISLGDGAQTSLDQAPHDLIIDRCYIHGSATGNQRRGIALNSASTAIIDSHISDCHEVGADSQAICGWAGPGPFKIVNNYLEGAGENVMFGGSDPRIPGLVPSDIEFRRNHCRKPLAWKPGSPGYDNSKWSVKNIFELKNARRVMVEGNLFENNWVNAQNGFAILFTPRNQDGASPWCVVEDVAFINNVVRHTAAGINIIGRDYNHPSGRTSRIKISNNLLLDVDGSRWGGGHGAFLMMTSSPAEITISHNTVLQSGHIILADGEPAERVEFTANIVNRGYGIFGSGFGEGNRAIERYFPGIVLAKNLIVGGSAGLYSKYPGNFFPSTLEEVGFEDLRAGSLGLTSASRFSKAAAEGGAPGCDLKVLAAAMGPTAAATALQRNQSTGEQQTGKKQ